MPMKTWLDMPNLELYDTLEIIKQYNPLVESLKWLEFLWITDENIASFLYNRKPFSFPIKNKNELDEILTYLDFMWINSDTKEVWLQTRKGYYMPLYFYDLWILDMNFAIKIRDILDKN